MRPLAAAQIVALWEAGELRCLSEKAYLMLAAGIGDDDVDSLLSVPVGRRDACLLHLRELTFGSKIEGVATCSRCSERLTFTIQTQDILMAAPDEQPHSGHFLEVDGYRAWFRVPVTADLMATRFSPGAAAARRVLIENCISRLEQGAAPVAVASAPAGIIEKIGEAIREYDPQISIRFQLSCPACEHNWVSDFDVVSFFWKELSIRAERLLQEVDTLARAYGWPESRILAMSAEKRRHYLKLAS